MEFHLQPLLSRMPELRGARTARIAHRQQSESSTQICSETRRIEYDAHETSSQSTSQWDGQ